MPLFERQRSALRVIAYLIAGIAVIFLAVFLLNFFHLIPAIPGFPRLGGPSSTTRTQVNPQTLQSHLVAQNKQIVYTKAYDQGVQFNQSNTPDGPFKDLIARFWHSDATFTAYGSVDAEVDYSQAKATAGPNNTIVITLPAPQLGKIYIDHNKSGVDGTRCGVNVFCHANETEFYRAAEQAFTEDAAKDLANTSADGLGGRARTQAEANVKALARDLGVDPATITVRFAEPTATPAPTASPSPASS
jgi:hypothetical protein